MVNASNMRRRCVVGGIAYEARNAARGVFGLELCDREKMPASKREGSSKCFLLSKLSLGG